MRIFLCNFGLVFRVKLHRLVLIMDPAAIVLTLILANKEVTEGKNIENVLIESK